MPTFTVDARAEYNQSDDIVALELSRNDRTVTMTARRDWTLEQLANEILAQNFPPQPDATFQRRLTIEAHQEDVTDPDTGTVYQIWVLDSVIAAQLPDEAAEDGFANLPGWAAWTADEAEAWIESNVMDLASAKVALTAMARAICYLRDWRR